MLSLYQIAVNNPFDFNNLLQNYNLPVPQNPSEYTQAVDYALDTYGNNFANDLQNIQLQKNAILSNEAAYKTQLDSSNNNQLKEEIIRLNLKLSQANDIYSREYLLDKIAYVQKLIIQKQENLPTNIIKPDQKILLILLAIALMFAGSKIFNK